MSCLTIKDLELPGEKLVDCGFDCTVSNEYYGIFEKWLTPNILIQISVMYYNVDDKYSEGDLGFFIREYGESGHMNMQWNAASNWYEDWLEKVYIELINRTGTAYYLTRKFLSSIEDKIYE